MNKKKLSFVALVHSLIYCACSNASFIGSKSEAPRPASAAMKSTDSTASVPNTTGNVTDTNSKNTNNKNTNTINTGSIADATGVKAALDGLRWELPCASDIGPCFTTDQADDGEQMPGNAATVYNVTLRFRGIVEDKLYNNATAQDGYFVTGGAPDNNPFNVYSLVISAPAQTYYLNASQSSSGIMGGRGGAIHYVDYTKTVQIHGNATIKLLAYSIDRMQTTPKDTSMVPPDVKVINGQFLQMNVVDIK